MIELSPAEAIAYACVILAAGFIAAEAAAVLGMMKTMERIGDAVEDD